ncbi:MAG: adenylyl-sulfate reductase subunit alpha [Lachnospiraceae bacterium]|nr:adenylyl-sulfate reductase subunit alpha [Lachnospiraceae bacterium]
MDLKLYTTDVLIIGGGTAGCAAAIRLKDSGLRVIVAEKANIKRSGCLASGVNALNAYISKGHRPEDYVDYAMKDAEGIAREDLLLSISERVNQVTWRLEEAGLPVLKDKHGHYATRGWRNVKINGENIKPLLAKQVDDAPLVTVINHINITDFIIKDRRVYGAVGFNVVTRQAVEIYAEATLIATGGAAGMYKPNNPGFSRHKMWYPPFNTGAGLAMGIRAGAEMTTFEMRFVALRCKDTIAPTGTIAFGVGAPQMNAKGEEYQDKYGNTTSERVYASVAENMKGNGPCYLKTEGISEETDDDLIKAYLNMAPQQTLKWMSGKFPSEENVEIEGSEPYVVGGHTASGYWVKNDRSTTIEALFAAGDIAGGAPQKYVTGAIAEGEIAAEGILSYLKANSKNRMPSPKTFDKEVSNIVNEYDRFFKNQGIGYSEDDLEETMQKIMDQYAGGISTYYRFNEAGLRIADKRIRDLIRLSDTLSACDNYELMKIYELRERLTVCLVLIAHLMARKETRWPVFDSNSDYPDKSEKFGNYFVNSVYNDGNIKIIYRKIKKEDKN